ncbi:M90 family metallopeptidase [Azohydromonas caseinilytica]|uniref:Zinc-dependent peptidase n=1 Tax=Azohydromonas caseinilytica TaxID=2728836 RepID=A0A848FEA8_9BURK|nr:M90 family metallopeptidase [Azohydromonas caseinilytica]NML17386.1 zinc-dependent peptidase [Azohydromonas caseinilytica]
MLAWLRQALQQRRENRALQRRPIPEALWQLTLRRFPFLRYRSEADLQALRRMCSVFLDSKEFHGAGGFELRNDVVVAVAAQACLLVLKLGLSCYDRFVGIVLHADAVIAPREQLDDVGVLHRYDEVLAGETMSGGPVMLSWNDVYSAGALENGPAYNVVIHEFAHVLDMRDGMADGLPLLPDPQSQHRWRKVLESEFKRLCRWVDQGMSTAIDPYGCEGLEEFFAVASEAFFVTPLALKGQQPAMYRLLASYYLQDPAENI